jgi:hypothetical protein
MQENRSTLHRSEGVRHDDRLYLSSLRHLPRFRRACGTSVSDAGLSPQDKLSAPGRRCCSGRTWIEEEIGTDSQH